MKMPKILKVFVITVIAIFAILGIGITALVIMYPSENIKALVLPHLENALGRDIEVEKVGISIYPVLGLKVEGLEVANTSREGFSKQAFIKIDKFLLKINILSLLKRELNITKIIFVGPDIIVETDREGSFNFDDLAVMKKDEGEVVAEKKQKTNAPVLPIPLTLKKFVIEKGKITYLDRKGETHLILGKVDQEVDVSIDKALKDIKSTGELLLDNISLVAKDAPKEFKGIKVTLKHDINYNVVDGILKLTEVKASLQKIYIAVTGEITEMNKAPNLDLAIKTEKLQIQDILSEITPEIYPDINKIQSTGSLQLNLAVKGKTAKGSKPVTTGSLMISGGEVKYTDLPEAITDLNADISFSEDDLNIKSLGLKLGINPVKLRAKVENFKEPYIDADLKADVDLGALKNVIKLPEGNELGGKIRAQIMARGKVTPETPEKMNLKGNIQMENLKVVTPALTKPLQTQGNVILTPKQISTNVKVKIGDSRINLRARIMDFLSLVMKDKKANYPRPRIQFDLNSPLLNTNEFLAEDKKSPIPSNAKASTESKSVSTPVMLLAAPLPAIDISGTITNKKVIYKSATLTNLKANVNNSNDILDFKVSSSLMEGTFSQDLNLDHRSIKDLKVKTKLNINNVEIGAIISNFRDMIPDNTKLMRRVRELDKNITGRTTFKADLTTNGATVEDISNNLNGRMDLALKNGGIKKSKILDAVTKAVSKIYNVGDLTFSDLNAKLLVENGNLIIDDLKMDSPRTGNWAVNGRVGLDTKLDLTISDRLTKNASSVVVKAQSKGKGAVKALLNNNQVASQFSGVVDKVGVPVDREGRVTVAMGVSGNMDDPKISSIRFTGKDEQGQQQQSLKNQAKLAAKKELEAKKKKLEAEAKKKLAEQKAKLAEEAKKATQSTTVKKVTKEVEKVVPKETTKKAKNVLKKFGL